MINVLERTLNHPFTTKSDFARENADLVAAAASEGFITTRIAEGQYNRVWHITPLGLSYLYTLKGINHE